MDVDNERLAHALHVKYGTAPFEPNEGQLNRIKEIIRAIAASGRAAKDEDWRGAVKLVCPSYETHKYSGVDNSDLNTLLSLATRKN